MKSGQLICGGSIFDDYHVITAAHCVFNRSEEFTRKPIKVLAGVNRIRPNSSNGVLVDVQKVYALREFVDCNYNEPCSSGDIAILKLKDPLGIDSNSNLSKITLPEKKSYVNKKAIVTGFGWYFNKYLIEKDLIVYDGGETDGRKRFAKAKVDSNEKCQEFYKSIVTEGSLCAHLINVSDRGGVCYHDDGGPLVYNGNILIGVLSRPVHECFENDIPAVYTRVSHYLKFIKKALNDKRDPQILGITLRISP